MSGAYYNEIDPFAAQMLRELIAEGVIAPGVVDERSIEDVCPDELSRFTQCHFFAGAGVWSYALRRAGWPDDRPIWTGSCPCQPFSQAGKGEGFADKRHLWPSWQWLIEQCGPECVAGEQVADKGADAWLDLVQADLEGMGYAFGCVPLASAGFGAPNPRHRSFWMAYAAGVRRSRLGRGRENGTAEYCHAERLADARRFGQREGGKCGVTAWRDGAGQCRNADGLGHAVCDGAEPVGGNGDCPQGSADGIDRGLPGASAPAWDASAADRLADTLRAGWPEGRPGTGSGSTAGGSGAGDRAPGPVNGYWADADWLYCRDPRGPRWRPVDSGTFPLAPSAPGRVGTLRLSGNAINAEVATGFIEAVIDHLAHSPAPVA